MICTFSIYLINECDFFFQIGKAKPLELINELIFFRFQIFCQSRNDVESTLAKLLQCVKLQINGNHRSALKPIANRYFECNDLYALMSGFA